MSWLRLLHNPNSLDVLTLSVFITLSIGDLSNTPPSDIFIVCFKDATVLRLFVDTTFYATIFCCTNSMQSIFTSPVYDINACIEWHFVFELGGVQ